MKENSPICGDCICRICAHNMRGSGHGCIGCNDCRGVIETEEECENSLGFELDEIT